MTKTTALESHHKTTYLRELLTAMVGYGIVLAIGLSLVGDDVDTAGDWILIMLPIVPALWGVRAIVRHLRRVDEYQRLLTLEAMAAGFGVAMVTALTVGFVGVGGTASVASGWIIYGAGMATWATVAAVQVRR